MFRSEDEKLTDTIMGEAVISVLKSDTSISVQRLLSQLQFMASAEVDSQRRNACEQLINEIRHGLIDRSKQTTYEVTSTDNVRHFFNAERPPDDNKKH